MLAMNRSTVWSINTLTLQRVTFSSETRGQASVELHAIQHWGILLVLGCRFYFTPRTGLNGSNNLSLTWRTKVGQLQLYAIASGM